MPGICGTAESPVVPQENLVDQYQFHVTYCAFFDPSQLVIKKPCSCVSHLHTVFLGLNSPIVIRAQIAWKGKHNPSGQITLIDRVIFKNTYHLGFYV